MTFGSTVRTGLLFVAMFLLLLGVGELVALFMGYDPVSSITIFLGIAVIFNAVSYFWGDKLILKAYRAKQVSEAEAPELHSIVANAASAAGIPKPQVYLIPTDTPNAFATGRNPKNGKVAFTQGILRGLDRDELYGVAAHEIGHINNRDVLVMTVATTMAAAIAFAARSLFWGSLFGGGRDRGHPALMLVIMITAPIAAMLVQMAISRAREFKADAAAARYTGNPRALASALKKLENWNDQAPMDGGNPAHASLFIVNPFKGGFASLFRTHPSTKERVRRLEAMA